MRQIYRQTDVHGLPTQNIHSVSRGRWRLWRWRARWADAVHKVDIIAGLDLLGRCLQTQGEEKRRRGRRWRGGGPKYLQCRPAFPDDSVSLLLRKLESPSQPLTPPAPPSVEDICYKIIYMYKKKREEKKKSILRFYLSHDRPEMKEEYKFIYFE